MNIDDDCPSNVFGALDWIEEYVQHLRSEGKGDLRQIVGRIREARTALGPTAESCREKVDALPGYYGTTGELMLKRTDVLAAIGEPPHD